MEKDPEDHPLFDTWESQSSSEAAILQKCDEGKHLRTLLNPLCPVNE